MEKDRVKLKVFGDISVLSPKLRRLILETERISARYEGVQNLCVNYGGRTKSSGRPGPTPSISENGRRVDGREVFRHFYSAGIGDPDLIIRPSGEMRLSNFLLWQAAYAELYFTDVLWPDFTEKELDRAILAYQKRDRRFGGVKG